MKNLALALGLVAIAAPLTAKEDSHTKRRFTFADVRSGDHGALKKLALWVVTGLVPQAVARKTGHISISSANVATAGTLLHAGGDVFDNDTAQDWGANCWFYALASELLRKVSFINDGLTKAYGYTTTDHDKSGFDDKTKAMNKQADTETVGVAKAIIATAALKLIIEEGPKLFSSAKECVQTEAQLPTAPAQPATPAAA